MVYPLPRHWNVLARAINEHLHSPQEVAPSGASPVTLTSDAVAWTLGNFSNDIIAVDTINKVFDLHWIDIINPDANADYEIVLYAGATDEEICRVSFTRLGVLNRSFNYPLQTELLAAGSRVRAKMMDSAGGNTCKVKVFYHGYEEV